MIERRPSELMASLLAGAWRENPSLPNLSEAELLSIAAMLQKSGAGGLAWWRIRQSGLRETSIGKELQQAYRLQILKMAQRELEIKQAFQLLRAESIEPILVKGWAIARLYPENGLRIFGDIDLFVPPKNRAKAERLLKETELQQYPIDLEHLDLLEMKDRSVEALYDSSQLVQAGDMQVRVLGAEDHLRFLAIHLLRHAAWRPIWFCDLALAIEKRSENFNWNIFFGSDKRVRNWVETAMVLTHRLLGVKLEDTPLAKNAERLPGWLIPNVLEQWERWCTTRGVIAPELIAISLRHPARLPGALKARWPDPLLATIKCRTKFNNVPRLPMQVFAFLTHVAQFSKRIPGLLLQKDSFGEL